jgi:hypothetical protein
MISPCWQKPFDPAPAHPKKSFLDREILDGLQRRGFRTNSGPDGTGFYPLVFEGPGGYYIGIKHLLASLPKLPRPNFIKDVGASQLIIDGKIKLKNDSEIERFTAGGLRFKDGSELAADVVVFATG